MNSSTTLAELAVTHPAAARVFYRHRLDFCCGGRRPLADVCRERHLDADSILAAIEAEDAVASDGVRWDQVPLDSLVQHIISTYHDRLRRQIPELRVMARKVELRHAEKPACPRGLTAHLEAMETAVFEHLQKEEQILFPLIVSGQGTLAAAPVHVMELEHEHHGEDLQTVRQLTGDLEPPAYACTTWRALYLGLQQLEQELMEHIHLENNVLFRRALGA